MPPALEKSRSTGRREETSPLPGSSGHAHPLTGTAAGWPVFGHPAGVGEECNHEAICAAFASRRTERRLGAIREAYLDPHADELMAWMLDAAVAGDFGGVVVAAHLGDLWGNTGDDALRRAVRSSGPGSRDVRCAALISLARRLGAGATPDLLVGLAASDAPVREYALAALAGAGPGDESGWAPVLQHIDSALRRGRRVRGSDSVSCALAYLSQNTADPARRSEIVTFIRLHWDALGQESWIAKFWPAASPAGPDSHAAPAPDTASIQEWAQDPLFRPLGVPSD